MTKLNIMAIADGNEEIVLGWGNCEQATLGHKGESLPSNQVHTHPLTDQQLSRSVNPKEILTQGDLYEDVHCGTGNGDEWEDAQVEGISAQSLTAEHAADRSHCKYTEEYERLPTQH